MKNRYLLYSLILAAFISVAVSSCYKIYRTHAPEEVHAGQQFDVRMVVVDDGNEYQKEITDWSVAAIRVPEDWTVECGSRDYESFAEDWVYYSNGKPAAARYTMRYSEPLSKAYDEAAPKAGYKWQAFVSTQKITKFMSACWRNGCDSAVVTFHVTAGETIGKYTIDYLAGDNEQDASPKNYSTASELNTDRMINASTVQRFKVPDYKNTSNYTPLMASKITVVADPDAITDVTIDNTVSEVYTTEGKKVTNLNLKSGTYIINGKKTYIK